MKESSMDFNDHLHNGDPLTSRTRQVPAGRPKAAPKNGRAYTFEESAIDALEYDGLTKVTDWSIGNTFLWLEKYNGSGYRTGAGRNTTPRNASPYIYSGTQFYTCGQYVRDGKFSAFAKAKNLGCMAFLKALEKEV
jgi:lysozyme family protein